MKRLLSAMLLAGMILVMGGCVPSLNPFFTPQDIVTTPSLAGTWSDADNAWTFTPDNGAKSYTLVIKSRTESAFTAHLVKLNKELYLDLAPKNYKTEGNEFYSLHLVPAHTLSRVRIEGDQLKVAAMDMDKVTRLLQADPTVVAHQFRRHEISENEIPLLLAPTRELQAFVNKHRQEIFLDNEFVLTQKK